MKINSRTLLNFSVLFLALIFYYYEFILQVSPSLLLDAITGDKELSAATIGVISGSFYYTYALMQVPAAIILNRWGIKKTFLFSVFTCSFGCFLFSYNSLFLMIAGRIIMGLGASFAFIMILAICAHRFPLKLFPVLAAVAQIFSALGAISGQILIRIMANSLRIHSIFLILTGFGIALFVAGLITLSVSSKEDQSHRKDDFFSENFWHNELNFIKEIFRKKENITLFFYSFMIWSQITAFIALWGVPYLDLLRNDGQVNIAKIMSLSWIGLALGSISLGLLCNQVRSQRNLLILCSCLGAAAAAAVILMPTMNIFLLLFSIFLIGFSSSGQNLVFSLLRTTNPLRIVNTANGFNNLFILLSGLIMQPLIGMLISSQKTIDTIASTSIRNALLIIPGLLIAATLIIIFGLKKNHDN